MNRLRLLKYHHFIVLLLLLVVHPTVTSSSSDNDENGHRGNNTPMGLQVWDTPSSFNQALEGGRLILVIITSSWCDRGEILETLGANAAQRIDDVFTSSRGNDAGELAFNSASLPKPLIGLLSSETASQLLLDGLGPITHYPALKFVVSSSYNCSVNDREKQQQQQPLDNNHGDDIDETKIWDFIGPKETAEDVYDSVMMYWYRNVVSSHISRCGPNKRKPITTQSETEFSNKHKHNPPIFEFTSQIQIASFLERYGEQLLRPAQARYQHQSAFDKEMFEFYTGLQHSDSAIGGFFHPYQSLSGHEIREHDVHTYTQEIDPYILFVQCRSSKGKSVKEDQSKARQLFEELAEEMMHRSDVAFFALEVANAKSCSGWFPKMSDGAIAAIRIKRGVNYSITPPKEMTTSSDQSVWSQRQKRVIRNVTTDWNDVKRRIPHALFIPSEYLREEDILSNLTKFAVIHTTPTVMWFDKSRVAQFAFPKYRTIHAVLFIDMALGYESSTKPTSTKHIRNGWPENLSYSVETERLLLDQQRAIQMFYNAALQYRSQHKDDSVVFLIVPSTETRILTTFGVDLWTPLDDALFGAVEENERVSDEEINHSTTCRRDSSPIMPIMAVTDASKRTGKQTSRYYLCSDDIFDPSDTLFEHGGAVKSFIDDVLDSSAVQFTRSEHRQVTAEPVAAKSNVTVVTGNTFQSLVMEREEHTMLLMKQSTCGHCKRFSIFWNEFQTIIQALNWSSVINVCKIDVTKNDVPHPQIDAWDIPSVYYFPAGSKETPIEMTPKYDKGSIDAQYQYDEGLSWVTSGYDVVEWMMKQGKLDLELLASLDANRADSIDEVTSTRQ